MKSVRTIAFALLTVLPVFGCIPEKRIAWSADGKTAAVSSDKGLYFIDREGRLLPPRLMNTPSRCAWFADGKRIAVAHVERVDKWSGLTTLFDEQQTASIRSEAKKLRERILAYEGDWDKFDIDPEKHLSGDNEMAVVMFMRDNDVAGVQERLGAKWDDLLKACAGIWTLQLFELSGDQLKPGRVLLRGLSEIHQPKLSPKQTAVAMVLGNIGDKEDDTASLQVVSISGGTARVVAKNVAMDYDWSPDGKAVALVRSSAPCGKSDQALQLGSLTTIQIAGDDGELSPEWGQASERVGLLFNPISGVRWLSDGRILFSTAEMSLPATNRDMPQQWSLFMLDLRMPGSVARAIARDFDGPLDPGNPMFEVSPDEGKILLHGPKGRVMLYDFREGTTTVIQGVDDADGKTRSLATWRGKDEISFTGPSISTDSGKQSAEIMIWQAGKSRTISTNWPPEMKDGWLTGK